MQARSRLLMGVVCVFHDQGLLQVQVESEVDSMTRRFCANFKKLEQLQMIIQTMYYTMFYVLYARV